REDVVRRGILIAVGSVVDRVVCDRAAEGRDRKSTRLNSSHVEISYAVFCLKKKKAADHARRGAQARKPTLASTSVPSIAQALARVTTANRRGRTAGVVQPWPGVQEQDSPGV